MQILQTYRNNIKLNHSAEMSTINLQTNGIINEIQQNQERTKNIIT